MRDPGKIERAIECLRCAGELMELRKDQGAAHAFALADALMWASGDDDTEFENLLGKLEQSFAEFTARRAMELLKQ